MAHQRTASPQRNSVPPSRDWSGEITPDPGNGMTGGTGNGTADSTGNALTHGTGVNAGNGTAHSAASAPAGSGQNVVTNVVTNVSTGSGTAHGMAGTLPLSHTMTNSATPPMTHGMNGGMNGTMTNGTGTGMDGGMTNGMNGTADRTGNSLPNSMTTKWPDGSTSDSDLPLPDDDNVFPDIRNNLPEDVIDAPTTMEEVYRGSMKSLLLRNVGNYMVATFLIGTQTTVSWEGMLYDVGNDYLVIYESGRDQYIVTDLYSLKYVEFYDTRRRQICDALMAEAGIEA